MADEQKQVPGASVGPPTNFSSASAEKVEKFASCLPNHLDDEQPMFGRAPLETRITVGHLREFGSELRERIHAYVRDIGKRVHDEHVIKADHGCILTVGDLRDFADANPLPEKGKK